MRVGIDVFTLNPLKLNPCAQLDLIKEMGLEGAQFGGLRSLSKNLDPGELRAVRERADALGLYSHVSLSITCNPLLARLTPEEHRDAIAKEIELAAACGWHELHSSLGGGDERYLHETPWPEHLAAAGRLIRSLGPALRQHGSRINLETHGDATTAELVRLVEDVGPDIAGICLDTANVLCHCEDPVLAAKRAAPYTHLTHVKDAVAYFTDHGFRRQTLPPGRGAIDWPVVLPILAEHSPNLPLSIEDHKWLFKFDCFDKKWLALHPDLALPEFAAFMRLVWQCQQRFSAGELPDPDTYERIPFADEVKERLAAGAGYLKRLIDGSGLHDRPHDSRPRSLSIMIK
jgi:sugar phosphate isomerase/epimerase